MDARAMTTGTLTRLILSEPKSVADIKFEEPKSLGDCIHAHMRELGVSVKTLTERAVLSKTFAYQILSDKRVPGRNVLLCVCFALALDLTATQRLLTVARKGALYPKVRRDAAVMACLAQKVSLYEADEFLRKIGEEPLI